MPPELLGPYGLVFALLIASAALWRSHLRDDEDMRVDRNYWRDLALKGTELADKATTIAVRKR
jgi:hypothetical protein